MSLTREKLEEREAQLLAANATLSRDSSKRKKPEAEHEYRTCFQRDRDRILHSKAFRRLKGKTQVFLAPKGDHYRTRLTHTLEVAQISRTAARALSLNEDLIEAIALGHDLGHTPFGHAGESVLNSVYDPGFRHYEQSLRVVDTLEWRDDRQGLNLTEAVRDGILNHSKGKSVLLDTDGETASTMEGKIMSVCDAIAYINHDIDDAIRAGVITVDDLPPNAVAIVGRSTAERINRMVSGLIEGSAAEELAIVDDVRQAIVELRTYLYQDVYPNPAIHAEIEKSERIVGELYAYLLKNPSDIVPQSGEGDTLARTIVDFIAGMTDQYALQLYQELFFPRSWHT